MTRDPIQLTRRRRTATWCAGVAVIGMASLWALRPIPRETVEPMGLPPARSEPDEESPLVPLDVTAFAAPVWNPPAPTAPAVDALAARRAKDDERPFRMELIAIIEEGGERFAVFYDPEADELRFARAGEALAGAVVETVGESEVAVVMGTSRRRFALIDEGVGGVGGVGG